MNKKLICEQLENIIKESWCEILNTSSQNQIASAYTKNIQKIEESIQKKGIEGDIVTSYDIRLNNLLVEKIEKLFPTFSIESEELDPIIKDKEYIVIIDPIDGTANFSHLHNNFSTAIAIVNKEKIPLIGIIYNPLSNEVFSSFSNTSYCNKKIITVCNKSLNDGILLLSDGSSDKKEGNNLIKKVLDENFNIRILGSAQLDLCKVACGKAVGYMKTLSPDWDSIAGTFILKNAGGKISIDSLGNVVGSNNQKNFENLLKIMNK
jgi:myo-inositol-1(or 4)-monophosphatase